MKAVLCVLLFLVLDAEYADFGAGLWNTPMALAVNAFRGNPINAWDVCLGAVALVTALRARSWREQPRPLVRAVLAALATILVMLAWGALRGGDVHQGYFQVAALLRMLVLVPVLIAVFRTSRDLRLLAGAVLVAALYRAVACILCFRLVFLANGGIKPWPEYVTDHHDSAFWTVAVVGLLTWLVLRFRARTLLVAGALLPILLMAIQYNQRRLAWIQLVGGLGLMYLTIPKGRVRRNLNRLGFVMAPLLVIYVAVGWGRAGLLFEPVDKIRSMVADPKDDSNRYRELENMGLVLTLQGSRVLGTGFGQQFIEVSRVYTMGAWERNFPNYRYVPHNSVLGLAAFTGIVGFPAIWTVMAVGAFMAARARLFAVEVSDQVLSSTAFVYPFIYGVQSFGDMGLFSLKVNVLLACALAIGGRLALLTGAWPARGAAPLPAP